MGVRKVDFQVKTINFWKRNKKRILVIFIIWVIIIIINNILKNRPEKIETPKTTYTPETSVMDQSKSVPKEKHKTISEVIDKYMNE